MVSKVYSGRSKDYLLSVKDDSLRHALFSPTLNEIIMVFAIGVIIIGIVGAWNVLLDDYNHTVSIGRIMYQLCAKDSLTPNIECESFNDEIKNRGITSENQYLAVKIEQERQRRIDFMLLVLCTVGGVILSAAIIKKINPFFLTSIEHNVAIEYDGKRLVSAKIGNAIMKDTALPIGRRGLMIRKFSAGDFIVSLYQFQNRGRMSPYRIAAPSQERVVLDAPGADELVKFLHRLDNVKFNLTGTTDWLIDYDTDKDLLIDFR
ncbi:MAG: hypothetical protein NTX79_03695 [Candidatus Micrarchaeota archaeon]|nr:hypothetical protein [Candidatus Micrarchaeota archaeon]